MLLEKIVRAELIDIMNQMELQYGIPSPQDLKWNMAHPDIIAAYRHIGNMRTL